MNLNHLMNEYFKNEKEDSFSLEDLSGLMSKPTPISVDKPYWEVLENPQRLKRKFNFKTPKKLLQFLFEVLKYEEKVNHNGSILIEGKSVTVEVYTHDLDGVTELDMEYAKELKDIFRDVEDYE